MGSEGRSNCITSGGGRDGAGGPRRGERRHNYARARASPFKLSLAPPLVLTWNKNNIGFDSDSDPSTRRSGRPSWLFRDGEREGLAHDGRKVKWRVKSRSLGRVAPVAPLMTGSGDEEGAAGGSHAARDRPASGRGCPPGGCHATAGRMAKPLCLSGASCPVMGQNCGHIALPPPRERRAMRALPSLLPASSARVVI